MVTTFPHEYHDPADSQKPVVVLLHGFLGCLSDWEEIATSLRRDFRTLLVDLPGHGGNLIRDTNAYTMNGCSLHLEMLLDGLGVKKAHFVGYSMGGRLALYFLLTRPGRCDRVILESASPGLKTEAERLERRRHDGRLARMLQREGVEAFLHAWYSQPLFESMKNRPQRFQALLDRRRSLRSTGLITSLLMMGTGAQPPLWQHLIAKRVPLLLIAGEKDPKFVAIAREMAGLCANARVSIMKGCGHNVHFEQPERFVREVSDFLQEDVRGNDDSGKLD